MDVFHFFGLRRSGNHALINWILAHYSGTRSHYNNAFIKPDGQVACHKDNEVVIEGVGRACRLINFEDLPLDVSNLNYDLQNILLLRDPFNTFASRIQRTRQAKGTIHEMANAVHDYTVNLWKQYAREFLGETSFLQNSIKINFNKWVINEDYRRDLSKHFGEFTDSGRDIVSEFTHGSSFDGFKVPDAEDLLNRWKHFIGDDEFQSVLDDELLDLSATIFGEICSLRPSEEQAEARLLERVNRTAFLLNSQGKHREALEIMGKAVKLGGNNAQFHSNLATTYAGLEDLDRAIYYAERAVQIEPHPECYNNLGLQYAKVYRIDDSIKAYQKAIENNADPRIYVNMGNAYADDLRLGEALDWYYKALEFEPENPGTHVNLAFTYHLLGAHRKGWREYEYRFGHYPQMRDYLTAYGYEKHWDGQSSLEGKTLCIYCEQGFGDVLQFIRYVPLFRSRYPDCKTIVNCHQSLNSLIQRVEGVGTVVSDATHNLDYDHHISLLSLPLILDEPLLQTPPYLSSTTKVVIDKKPAIGVCWKGNPKHPGDRFRSMDRAFFDFLGDFTPLQKGESEHSFDTFEDTANVIDALDLVITVDTSILHLAGAMGKPTLALIPYRPDWRWGLNKIDTPWYPSIKLLRQSEPCNWKSVMAKVRIWMKSQGFSSK